MEERVYIQVFASIYATPRFEKKRLTLDESKQDPQPMTVNLIGLCSENPIIPCGHTSVRG